MSIPRRHHYVPVTYLSGFVDGDGQLDVLDRTASKSWRQRPEAIAHQRDFYRLDQGEDLLAVETLFSKLEGFWPDVRTALLNEGGIPKDDLLRAQLFLFMSAQFMRVPSFIGQWHGFLKQVFERLAWSLSSSTEAWEAAMESVGDSGHPAQSVSAEDARAFLERGNYQFSADKNSQLAPMVKLIPFGAEVLEQRQWSLVRVSDEQSSLVTSDRPICLHWNDPAYRSPFPPGLASPETMATFPVCSTAMLVGLFEAPFSNAMTDDEFAGISNSITATRSPRFVLGSSERTRFRLLDGSLGGQKEFLRDYPLSPDEAGRSR